MKRRLLNLLTALSLLMCVAVVALWVQSYQFLYAVSYQSPRVELVEWYAGWYLVGGSLCYSSFTSEYRTAPNRPPPSDVGLSWESPIQLDPGEAWVQVVASRSQADDVLLNRAGFHLAHSVYGDSAVPQLEQYRRTVVQVPLWFIAILFAAAPLSVLFRRSNRAGFCATCGYNLRATPGRCPECGQTTSMRAMRATSLLLCTVAGGSAGFVAGMLLLIAPVAAQAGPVMVVTVAGAGAGFVAWRLAVWPRELWTHRRVRGLCQTCGYDLRGNVSGVCSECGTTRAPSSPVG